MEITKANVISLPDLTQVDQVTIYLNNLRALARGNNHAAKVKLGYILESIRVMSLIDLDRLQNVDRIPIYEALAIEIGGIEYTKSAELIKSLDKPNIYELRINIREFNWRFRATFFPAVYKDDLYYCLVYPFEKVQGAAVDPTNGFRDNTYTLYQRVIQNPGLYLDDE
jgi:hypothetical protein